MAAGGGLRRPPYAVCIRLAWRALAGWNEYDGYCVDRGIDPHSLSASRLLNHVYFVISKDMKEKDRRALDRDLEQRLPSWKPSRRGDDRRPGWWKGDTDAMQEAQEVMKFLQGVRGW